MKRICLMLLVAACGRELAAMQAATRMRDEMVARAATRLQLEQNYEALRKEFAEYNAIGAPTVMQRNAFIQASKIRLNKIKDMERGLASSTKSAFSSHFIKLDGELSVGKASLEAFEALVQSSIISNTRMAQEEGKRSGAAAAVTAAGEPAQRESKADAEQAATATAGAGAGAGTQTATASTAGRGGNDERKAPAQGEDTKENPSITDEDVMQVGAGAMIYQGAWVLAGIAKTGGKWAIKGSNPMLAAGMTVAETYQLYCWWQRRKTRKS